MTDPTTSLLRDVDAYVSAQHARGWHDQMAANLGCAGCELRDRIATLLSTLPEPTDQAAVLREEVDRIDATRAGFPIAVQNGITWATAELRRHAAECPQCGTTGACNGGPCPLRRMADGTQPETEAPADTLPAWLYQRFMPDGDWGRLDTEQRAYWEHEARAVRRAITRGGFKQPAAGARQDGAAS